MNTQAALFGRSAGELKELHQGMNLPRGRDGLYRVHCRCGEYDTPGATTVDGAGSQFSGHLETVGAR